jgi:hypothetical protein
MSEENVEIVRRLTLAAREADPAKAWAAAAGFLDPEIEMDTTRVPASDLARIYRGPDEVAQFWANWLEAWGSLGDFEEPEFIDAGAEVFSWITKHQLRGRSSGVQVDMPEYGWVMTIRNGKVVHSTLFTERAEALEAAGLSE